MVSVKSEWNWLSNVPLCSLLMLIRGILGPQAALSLSNDICIQYLDSESWKFLAGLSFMSSAFTGEGGGQQVSLEKSGLISDRQHGHSAELSGHSAANRTVWLDNDGHPLIRTDICRTLEPEVINSILLDVLGLAATNSGDGGFDERPVIVDVTKTCPICTLSLHARVASEPASNNILVFPCGHYVHQICASRAKTSLTTTKLPHSEDSKDVSGEDHHGAASWICPICSIQSPKLS